MTLALNKSKLDNLAGEIWRSAESLRGKFKAYEYQNVILPIILIRRLECVLLAWREAKGAEIRAKRKDIKYADLNKMVKALEKSEAPFSNKTNWTLDKIYRDDTTQYEKHFRDYINGISKNVDDIIEHFNYRAIIGQIVKYNRLGPLLSQYRDRPFGPDQLSNLENGLHLRGAVAALLRTKRRRSG